MERGRWLGPRLGRTRSKRPGKYVGILYYIWHGAHGYDVAFNPAPGSGAGPAPKDQDSYRSPFLISEILAQPPESRDWGPVHAFHHWGESQWGYYLADDEWVIRRNAQLLTDAGVDVIFFDATNGFTYRDVYEKICRVYTAIREDGNQTPQIAFISWNGDQSVPQVYKDSYEQNLYSDLWFRWKGKPLILSKREHLTEEMEDFFSVRESWAWSHDGGWFGDGKDKWPWLDDTPQAFGWHESADVPEMITVASAQHPTTNKGKSYHDGKMSPKAEWATEKGLYFSEQWERALEVDPEIIVITQWNEWIAQRFLADGPMDLAGGRIDKGDSFFVDVYSMEFNRDVEPMVGGYEDNYYYQMVDGIRRFKGASTPSPVGVYTDDRGDTFHRNHDGYGSAGPYVNTSDRNDLIAAKVTPLDSSIRISATAAAPLSRSSDQHWMMLFLKIADSSKPHWEGFHYLINRVSPEDGMAVLEQSTGGWAWEQASQVPIIISGDTVSIDLPRSLFGGGEGEPVSFEFKWVDNMQNPGVATDWMVHGDTAPNSRFTYSFTEHSDGDARAQEK